MKKNFLLSIVLTIILSVSISAQVIEQPPATNNKVDQSKLYNDVYLSYGIGSLYIFTGKVSHSYSQYSNAGYYGNSSTTDASSFGTFMIGYNRMINHVIMIGFSLSYLNVNYSTNYDSTSYYQGYDYAGRVDYNDNLFNGMAKITFNYVNKPLVRVYSGFGLGITVDLSSAMGNNASDVKQTAKKIIPAGQLTFLGVRFGRTLGGFCEFGIGTNSIIAAGINYQFGD